MKVRYAIFAVLAATVMLTSVAAAGPAAAKQRVSIAIKGNDAGPGTFVLTPLQAGALKEDSGKANVVISGPKVVIREGQRIEIYNLTWTLAGKRGSLTTRERLDWIDTGDAFIGVGTWKVVKSTGAYAKVTGGGRSASVGHNHGNGAWYIRHDGFLTVP